jgi:NitT/TauT family transport system permease protein
LAAPRMFPTSGAWRFRSVRPADVLVLLALFALLFGLLELIPSLSSPSHPQTASSTISLDPAEIPYYAVRSLLRMFIGLFLSVVFTLVYATAAARLPRAEKILLPILDILQSVPVLGFLTVIASTLVALFPGSDLGLEFASIFAIFTSMAWNITFAFHASLVSQPRELDEAARVMRLTKWQRFWKLDVPSGMIPMIWNGMMSFGGAWFFLTASEAISVDGKSYALPGIGSYVATAALQDNLGDILWAIIAMVVMVLGVNFLFWRPMVAWAERFRIEDSASADKPRSVVLDLIRRSQINDWLARPTRPFGRAMDSATRPFGLAEHPLRKPPARQRTGDVAFTTVVVLGVLFGVWEALSYIHRNVGFGQFGTAFGDGALTFLRVIVVLIVSTVVWVPIGVWIGMNPRSPGSRSPRAGRRVVPGELPLPLPDGAVHRARDRPGLRRHRADADGRAVVHPVQRDRRRLDDPQRPARVDAGDEGRRVAALEGADPARDLPAYVTGAITAAGGAWNASIVAEFVTYDHRQIAARASARTSPRPRTPGTRPRSCSG